ncbi:MAG: ankyrin repeat domain-containing protein [Halobacteriovoraceae bacterium]|nr:ankyrin repeat domain-containing protein [Halobacteriovoraceae bacterium]MCB9095754.1 ankyrin repeat domain-containing protein [Halobacteriovoraceae bacterium]
MDNMTFMVWTTKIFIFTILIFHFSAHANFNLWKAAALGDIIEVKRLIAADPTVDMEYRDGGFWDTPLSHACYYQHYDMVDVLIEGGADVNAPRPFGSTCLSFATTFRDSKLFYILLAHPFLNVRYANKLALDRAIGEPWMVEEILKLGPNVNEFSAGKYRQGKGYTPIMKAILLNDYVSLEMILTKQPKLELVTKENLFYNDYSYIPKGSTALIIAAFFNRVDALKLLINKGARINSRTSLSEHGGDYGSKTALELARSRGNEEAVKILISAGAYE